MAGAILMTESIAFTFFTTSALSVHRRRWRKSLPRQHVPWNWNWFKNSCKWSTLDIQTILNVFNLVGFHSFLEVVIDHVYISKLKISFSLLSSHFSQGRSIWLWRNCLELLYQRNSPQLRIPLQREWRSCRLTFLPESSRVCSCLFPLTSQQQYNNR